MQQALKVVTEEEFEQIESDFLNELFFQLDQNLVRYKNRYSYPVSSATSLHYAQLILPSTAKSRNLYNNQQLWEQDELSKVWNVLLQTENFDRLKRIIVKCIQYIEEPNLDRFSQAHDLLLHLIIPDQNLPRQIVRLLRHKIDKIKEQTNYKVILRCAINLSWQLNKYHPST